MHGLFVPLGWGLGPGDTMHVPAFACESVRRWIAVLGSCIGVHWTTAHTLGQRDALSPTDVASYVDTALEGAVVASLGGYSHTRYWSVAIADLDLGFMPITPVEFVAYYIEVILTNDGACDGARVVINTEPMSSAGVICGESPSALLMRAIYVHSEIAGLPEFRAPVPTLGTGYCFG